MDRFKFIKNKDFASLPKTAGVYAFYDKTEPIYIGKAINIQNRVKNHFNQPSYRDDLFIEKVNKIGYFETGSEIEALILEANLIKKYQPKYNVVWKDGKNYFYVAVENNNKGIPFVYITHQRNNSKTKYIGPFVEGTALKKTLRFLRRAFPYYTNKKHPKTKCTYCHLGLCPGPNPDLKEYKNNIKKLILVLQGKRSAAFRALRAEMKQLSKDKNFEEAAKVRDRMFNLQQIMAHTHVIGASDMAGNFAAAKNTATLKNIIGLEKEIKRIECYDVSNIQGKFATGSMAVFVNGVPDKSQYKKFKIRMENEPNDIAMLKEILSRRFAHQDWPMPDVILIDGGKGQLNAAVETKSHKLTAKSLRVISIAKGRQELFIEGRPEPIALKLLPQKIYNLVKQLDDEAHRFAISYHKQLRKKNLLK